MLKKKKRFIFILTVTSILITIISLVFNFVIPIIAAIFLPINKGDSIAIIGGADGPTAIYIASNTSQYLFFVPIIFAILSILGIIYLFKNRRNSNF